MLVVGRRRVFVPLLAESIPSSRQQFSPARSVLHASRRKCRHIIQHYLARIDRDSPLQPSTTNRGQSGILVSTPTPPPAGSQNNQNPRTCFASVAVAGRLHYAQSIAMSKRGTAALSPDERRPHKSGCCCCWLLLLLLLLLCPGRAMLASSSITTSSSSASSTIIILISSLWQGR